MTWRLALCLLLWAGTALASSAPAPKDAEADAESANGPKRFAELPPSDHAYPIPLLVKMRSKLTGDYKNPDETHAPRVKSGNGH